MADAQSPTASPDDERDRHLLGRGREGASARSRTWSARHQRWIYQAPDLIPRLRRIPEAT
jgi:hypothetical protein